jgi:hypothetical protein
MILLLKTKEDEEQKAGSGVPMDAEATEIAKLEEQD